LRSIHSDDSSSIIKVFRCWLTSIENYLFSFFMRNTLPKLQRWLADEAISFLTADQSGQWLDYIANYFVHALESRYHFNGR
jgi:hypothetical protein